MKVSVSNVGKSQCVFCGINVGKGINAGVEAMRSRVKNVDSFSHENLPNKVVEKVLGGSSMSGGNSGYVRDEHLAKQIAKWKELHPGEKAINIEEASKIDLGDGIGDPLKDSGIADEVIEGAGKIIVGAGKVINFILELF